MTDFFDSVLRSAKILVLLCICAAILMLAWAGTTALNSVTLAANEHRELAADGRAALSGVIVELDATLQRVSVAADQFAEASKEQRVQALETTKQVTQFASELTQLAQDARSVVRRVEDETIPALNFAIRNQDSKLAAVMEESARLIYDTNKRLEPIEPLMKDAAESLAKVNATMDSVQASAKHTEGTLENVEAMSKDTAEAVHRLTRPARSSWEVLKAFGKWFLQAFTAFK